MYKNSCHIFIFSLDIFITVAVIQPVGESAISAEMSCPELVLGDALSSAEVLSVSGVSTGMERSLLVITDAILTLV